MTCTSITVEEEKKRFELLVNGKKGTVKVNLNEDVKLRIQGADPNDDCRIDNISTIPDTMLCEGDSNSNGIFECTVQFVEDTTIKVQGYEDCFAGICNKKTNVVTIQAGAGAGAPLDDWTKMVIYAAGILGGAYVLSSLLKGRD